MNTNYENFSTIELAVDDAFLQHYLFPTTESDRFWKNWLNENPEKSAEWNEAGKLIEAVQLGLSDYTRTYLSEEAEAELLSRILATNHELVSADTRIVPMHQFAWVKTLAAAAVIIAMFAGGMWILKERSLKNSPYSQRVAVLSDEISEHENKTTVNQTFTLPDGSTITLSPKSKISYAKDFGVENRTVYLSGKGIFDVSKDPLKPFFVYANEIVTKVLGTRFEISAFEEDRDVIVKVQSGQVSVYKTKETDEKTELNSERTGVLLLPNQQVVFVRQTEQFNKILIENPSILTQQDFIYEETPVIKVLEDVEKAYGVDLVYNNDVLKNCGLTADLSHESLYDKLDVICISIGATYETVDAQIIINSRGCKPDTNLIPNP